MWEMKELAKATWRATFINTILCQSNFSAMRIHILITMLLASTQEMMGDSANIFHDVANFLSDNGFKYVSIKGPICCHFRGLSKAIVERRDTFLRWYNSYPMDHHNFHMDTELLMINTLEEVTMDVLLDVAMKKVQRTVIVILNPSKGQMSAFRQKLQGHKTNSLFYMVIVDQVAIQWYQVITLKSGYALGNLEFVSNSYQIKENKGEF